MIDVAVCTQLMLAALGSTASGQSFEYLEFPAVTELFVSCQVLLGHNYLLWK